MLFAVRRMKKSDLKGVLSIEKASYRLPWSRQAFESEIRSRHAHPIVISQPRTPGVLGYLCCWIVQDECHILNLAVHPAFRRMGFASRLIQSLFGLCRDRRIGRFFLEVRASNDNAISLYRKSGFEVCGVRKRYYPDTGEDALIMRRMAPCL